MHHLLSTLASLLFLLSPLSSAQVCCPTPGPSCISTGEAANLALRWLQIFQTDGQGAGIGAALIPSTIALNFTYYDEGASFGEPGPLVRLPFRF
jgi:hypothetical protein